MKDFFKALPQLAVALFLLAGSGCSSLPGSSRSAEPAFVIENVAVVDGVNGLRRAQTVLVRGNTIAKVGNAREVRVPKGVRVIDGQGKYLIPGLWDAHVHLTTFPDLGADTWYPLLIANGVTSVRDMGSPLEKILAWRAAARAKGAIAPRIFIAGPLIDGPSPLHPFVSLAVHNVAEARAKIDSLKAAGVDFIKLYEMLPPDVFTDAVHYSHELGLPVAGHSPSQMDVVDVANTGIDSLEHFRSFEMACSRNWSEFLVERRAVLGLVQTNLNLSARSAGDRALAEYHTKFLQKNRGSAPASTWERFLAVYNTQSDRAVRTQDDARCETVIAALKANNVFQTPTLTIATSDEKLPFNSSLFRKNFDYLPASVRREWNAGVTAAPAAIESPYVKAYAKAYSDWAMAMVARLEKHGVKLMTGTDGPPHFLVPGFALHQELVLLSEAGLTPLEILTAATLRPAEFMRLTDKLGTIDKGKWADMVLLEANPLDDIRNTEKIAAVINDGRVFDRAALDEMLATLKTNHAK